MFIALGAFGAGLLLNIGFVLTLPLRIPRGARWAGLLWVIMAAGLTRWFGSGGGVTTLTSVDSSVTWQIISIGLSGIATLFLFNTKFRTPNLKFPFALLLTFAVLGVMTAPIALFPPLYAFKAASLIIAVLVAVMSIKSLVETKDPALLFNIMYIYFILLSFLAVLGGIVSPETTHSPNKGVFSFMLKGWPSLNSNSLSYVTAVVFVVSLHRIFSVPELRLRFLYGSACTVGAIGLLLAQGRTSLIAAAIAVLFLSRFSKDMHSIRFVMLIALGAGTAVFLLFGSVGDWTGVVEDYLRRGVDDESLSTLSGRTEAWKLSWELFLEKPIFGYGFYASGKELLAPHNAAFTILLNGGAIGFIPWLAAIIGGMWVVCRRLFDKKWMSPTKENGVYLELVAVIIVQFFRIITGQDLTIHSYSMLIFLGILVYIYSRNQIEANEQLRWLPDEQINNETEELHHKNTRILQPRRKRMNFLGMKTIYRESA